MTSRKARLSHLEGLAEAAETEMPRKPPRG